MDTIIMVITALFVVTVAILFAAIKRLEALELEAERVKWAQKRAEEAAAAAARREAMTPLQRAVADAIASSIGVVVMASLSNSK